MRLEIPAGSLKTRMLWIGCEVKGFVKWTKRVGGLQTWDGLQST